MFYDEVTIKEIESDEEYNKAWGMMVEEFPDHKDTDLLTFYEYLMIAKKSNDVIGLITINKYLPKRALLCDIVVKKEYRNKGIGIKLLKHIGMKLRDHGYTHVTGFTPKQNKEALRIYKRIHTNQEEMIVTTGELSISIPHIEQIELRLRSRYKEARRVKNVVR